MKRPSVVVLDYGSGNLRSAQRALDRAGADVEVTSDRAAAATADGLVIPGVGAFAACMAGLTDVGAPEVVGRRLAAGRPVLGICIGMQVMFDGSAEHDTHAEGFGEWPGTVERLHADVLPHMGWNTVEAPEGSALFAGVEKERFYFVHSFAVRTWAAPSRPSQLRTPLVTWSDYGEPFVAAVEDGALSAVQFHPEKSGDAGCRLLQNWVATLPVSSAA